MLNFNSIMFLMFKMVRDEKAAVRKKDVTLLDIDKAYKKKEKDS